MREGRSTMRHRICCKKKMFNQGNVDVLDEEYVTALRDGAKNLLPDQGISPELGKFQMFGHIDKDACNFDNSQ